MLWKRREPEPNELQLLIETNRHRGAQVWGSSFTVWDSDSGLPLKGGGVVTRDGVVLAGEAMPVKEQRPGWMIGMDKPPPVMGTIPTNYIEDVRDHAGRLRDSGDRTGSWSNDVVWTLAAEVVMMRAITSATRP